MAATFKAQHLFTINSITALGTSLLKNVSYNSNTVQNISGTLLNTVLYTQNVIEFKSLTNNSVAFQLDGLPTHKKIIVRARVFTECLST